MFCFHAAHISLKVIRPQKILDCIPPPDLSNQLASDPFDVAGRR